MTWQPERSSVNQKIQIGAEASGAHGTAVAASKSIQCFGWVLGIEADVNFFTATGHKYPAVQQENMEWAGGTMNGTMDYNGLIYPCSSIMGAVSPVAHLSSATAKDWIFSPPLSGSVEPTTYTIQQGDSVRAHQVAYALFTEWGYTVSRKEAKTTGKLLTQSLSDGITMTGSPSAIALAPIVGKQANIYLDSSQGALGTTQLNRVLQLDFSMANTYGPLWVLNRATPSWTAHVDLMPKAEVKLKVEADSQGMALLAYLQSGVTYYLRVDAQGAQIASDGPGSVVSEFKHDLALKFNKPSTFSDDQGVFAIEWTAEVVEDSTWGHSHLLTLTNLLTAL